MLKKLALVAGVTGLAVPAGALSIGGSRALDHAYGARWSPTGKRVAFVALGRRRNPSLNMVTAAGTRLVKLTGNWYVAQAPAWSPRGRKLAFVRIANVSRATATSSLWTIDIRTRVKRRLTLSAASFDNGSDPAWSPSGSTIAFTLLDEPPNSVPAYRIYAVKANGGRRRFLAQGQRPQWSPDGKKILFETTPRLSSETRVLVVNPDGTGARLLAAPAAQPEFSPDGRRIAFQRDGEIWVMNADGSSEQRLTHSAEVEFVPRWSPDGRRIAFLRGASPPQLYVMNADGSGEAPIAPSSAIELDPDWSPNGKRITYTRCTSNTARSCGVDFAYVSGGAP